ncbi:DUF4349 domain-containing protein [Nocardioides lijunqiniae]|uniref:DUF4349 domain-containing protein n=1 Tax=Nocardioides lijunqiniae TaxID=2760832 RepID=UPI00187759AF|nr:DUF4349 domain-containing protein [Nocardioides lijunqiniae]
MTRASRPSPLRRLLATSALAAVLVGSVAACSSGSDSAGGSDAGEASQDSGGGDSAAEERLEGGADALSSADRDASAPNALAADPAQESADTTPATERKLISQGSVQLRSPDVGKALFDVQKVVDSLAGEIAQNDTVTDKQGEVKRARLVLRVPSASFAKAVAGLEGAADLIASSTNVEDVTTQVIDTDVKVRVQRRSIRRIEVLLDQATSIRDIVDIEGQLAQRQARLGSLERQQAYLADQTSQATLTVSIERTPAKKAPAEKKKDRDGFLAGLDSGWTGFKNVTVALATALGAALPFLAVLALLAFPARLVVRRAARRRAPAAADA